MELREVKLTAYQHMTVLFRFLYDAFPWKWILMSVASGSTAAFLTRNENLPTIVFVSFMGLMMGVVLGMFSFLLLPEIYADSKAYLIPLYEEHKLRVKEEILDKVDDQILK